jgi:threonine dehydratase
MASPVMYESLRRGEIVEIPMEVTIAEALHGGIERGAVTFEIVKDYVDEILLVEEEDIKTAISLFLNHQNQVVEGAGVVGLAALMKNKSRFRGRRVGIIVSGGNIEISLLREILLEEDSGMSNN